MGRPLLLVDSTITARPIPWVVVVIASTSSSLGGRVDHVPTVDEAPRTVPSVIVVASVNSMSATQPAATSVKITRLAVPEAPTPTNGAARNTTTSAPVRAATYASEGRNRILSAPGDMRSD